MLTIFLANTEMVKIVFNYILLLFGLKSKLLLQMELIVQARVMTLSICRKRRDDGTFCDKFYQPDCLPLHILHTIVQKRLYNYLSKVELSNGNLNFYYFKLLFFKTSVK
jgi:hypothetical protein